MPQSNKLKANSSQLTAKPAFTLIELLIVVTIISILAVIGLANYRSVSRKARDDARRADIAAIQQALEQIYAEEGTYPWEMSCDTSLGQDSTSCTSGGGTNMDWQAGGVSNNLIILENQNYIDDLPLDPEHPDFFYYYNPLCSNSAQGEQSESLCGTTITCDVPNTTIDPNDLDSNNCCSYELGYWNETDGNFETICPHSN